MSKAEGRTKAYSCATVGGSGVREVRVRRGCVSVCGCVDDVVMESMHRGT